MKYRDIVGSHQFYNISKFYQILLSVLMLVINQKSWYETCWYDNPPHRCCWLEDYCADNITSPLQNLWARGIFKFPRFIQIWAIKSRKTIPPFLLSLSPQTTLKLFQTFEKKRRKWTFQCPLFEGSVEPKPNLNQRFELNQNQS